MMEKTIANPTANKANTTMKRATSGTHGSTKEPSRLSAMASTAISRIQVKNVAFASARGSTILGK